MSGLTHRERFLRCLNHKEPDRVVVELGSMRCTGIHSVAHRRLKEHLGLGSDYALVEEFGIGRRGSLARIDESIQQRFDLDLHGIFLGQAKGSPEINLPDGSYRDEWGVTRRATPGSYYHEIVGTPLSGEITLDDLKEFAWPDPHDPQRYQSLREDAIRASCQGEYPVVLNLGDICVHQTQFCRGFEDWLLDFALHPDLIDSMLKKVTDIRIAMAEEALRRVGDIIDLAQTADDVATQQGLLISPKHYREFIKPNHKRLFDAVRAHTPAKIMYHCCGNVIPILGDLVEIGVEVLNPIQVSAQGMDTAFLKREYGDRLIFTGGIDTQKTLRQGSPEQVAEEVRRRIDDLGSGGGYIVTAVHNIQPDVPPENICAMYDTALTYGRN